jgi:hypothetical protein
MGVPKSDMGAKEAMFYLRCQTVKRSVMRGAKLYQRVLPNQTTGSGWHSTPQSSRCYRARSHLRALGRGTRRDPIDLLEREIQGERRTERAFAIVTPPFCHPAVPGTVALVHAWVDILY